MAESDAERTPGQERALERLDEALMACADVRLTAEQIVGHVLEHLDHHAD